MLIFPILQSGPTDGGGGDARRRAPAPVVPLRDLLLAEEDERRVAVGARPPRLQLCPERGLDRIIISICSLFS